LQCILIQGPFKSVDPIDYIKSNENIPLEESNKTDIKLDIEDVEEEETTPIPREEDEEDDEE
jgi:hypothetical protein